MMKLIAFVALIVVLVAQVVCVVQANINPEQVHLSAAQTPDRMNVMWVTQVGQPMLGNGESLVQYGLQPYALTMTAVGSNHTFTDSGTEHRNITIHNAVMPGLKPITRYYYRVGNHGDGWSTVFTFVSLPSASAAKYPLRFGVYGDLGDTNAQSLTHLQSEIQMEELDVIVHVGDFAYDLHDDQGMNGDAFMRELEPIAANIPYLTCLGNHESAYNFSHYVNRFNGMPVNSGKLPPEAGANVAGMPNNFYFSYNIGNIHFLALDSELYFDYSPSYVQQQYEWATQDLIAANKNRTAAPWIIVYAHRPMYCSCDDSCGSDAERLRNGPFYNGTYGLDNLLHTYGADMFIAGHEHNYERMVAIYNGTARGGSGNMVVNPRGTVNIITGSAGCVERHEPFTLPQPSYTAYRNDAYGYSRMYVHNATHLFWQQVMTDNGEPQEEGKVIDYFWLVQDKHGPFTGL